MVFHNKISLGDFKYMSFFADNLDILEASLLCENITTLLGFIF